jgi:hypothetical protein
MRERGRVPVRVALRAEPDDWHYVVGHQTGAEERNELGGTPGSWSPPAAGPGGEPARWNAPDSTLAADLREYIE